MVLEELKKVIFLVERNHVETGDQQSEMFGRSDLMEIELLLLNGYVC